MSSEPPEEPHLRSEPHILSPASPKPIHFPTPTNIPVLEKQMDVGFNQTEAHMSDPATRNTEIRPDFWRDPNELTVPADQASPYSTGGEATQLAKNDGDTAEVSTEPAGEVLIEDASGSKDATSNEEIDSEPNPISNSRADPIDNESGSTAYVQPSSDPSVPNAEFISLNQDGAPGQSDSFSGADPSSVAPSNSNVDVLSLLDTLQTVPAPPSGVPSMSNAAPYADGVISATSMSSVSPFQYQQQESDTLPPPPGVEGASSPLSASGLGVPPPGLPSRPPPQEQPLIHPNYVHSQHIRDYHPHAANPAFQPHARSGSQGNAADPTSRNFVPPVNSPSDATASQPTGYPSSTPVPNNSYASNGSQGAGPSGAGVYTPNSMQNTGFAASPQNYYGAQYPSTSTPVDNRRERSQREGEQRRPEDRPWDAEVQRKYDRFIEEERRYVSEGRWEQFPQGSRLFVGNLSSEKVTKRDIFHVFHTYGDLAQISIKQAYGFVQFLHTEDCVRALEREQGTQIRDKKIHLEVSKPQKNRIQNTQRRSRSPPDGHRGRPGSNVDRYVSGGRGGNNRGNFGGYRSPSPRGYRDRYDDRSRRRSRSPGYGRGGRYRSSSPRPGVEDDLPLPRRAPQDVPDVQIIVLDSLDRDFISWVEQAFSSRGIRVEVLLLSPRLSEEAVIHRQIVEGVAAVVKLTRQNQNTSKIGVRIFDRRQGANNVTFEQYDGLDPPTAVQLVIRAKQSQTPSGGYGGYSAPSYNAHSAPPSQQSYGGYGAGSYGQQQSPQQGYQGGYNQQAPHPGSPPGIPPNLQSLITNLDPSNLQNLLSAMNTPQSANSSNPYANPSHPNSAAVAALQNNPALAGYLQQHQQQQQAQQQQQGAAQGGSSGGINMQDILARLGTQQR